MKKKQNYLEFIPKRNFKWYVSPETNKVIIERPKFDNALLKKYVVPLFKKPIFEIKLDEFGSFVWQQIDGEKPIYQIANLLKQKYGKDAEPVYERVSQFIKNLRQQRMIDFKS